MHCYTLIYISHSFICTIGLLLDTCSALFGIVRHFVGSIWGNTIYYKMLNALLYINIYFSFIYMVYGPLPWHLFGAVRRFLGSIWGYTIYYKMLNALLYINIYVSFIYMVYRPLAWHLFGTVRQCSAHFWLYLRLCNIF